MAKGKQGYKARKDESLGMRTGPERDKKQSMKARRDESYGDWGTRTEGYAKGGKVDIEDISSEEWFKEQTTPVYRNINKWVDETATPDVKFADPHRIVLNKNLKKA
jgi:hypothetical protein